MNLAPLDALWVYLSASPLLHLLLTLVAFLLATAINRLARGASLAHPVLVSIALIIGFLWLTDTDYPTYFEGAQFIHFLLGPATVALAVPLFDHLDRVKQMLWPLLTACCVGIVTAVTTTLGLALALGAHTQVALSLAPKSVTSPIAMGIAEKTGRYSLADGRAGAADRHPGLCGRPRCHATGRGARRYRQGLHHGLVGAWYRYCLLLLVGEHAGGRLRWHVDGADRSADRLHRAAYRQAVRRLSMRDIGGESSWR